jgi:hypothetical protein
MLIVHAAVSRGRKAHERSGAEPAAPTPCSAAARRQLGHLEAVGDRAGSRRQQVFARSIDRVRQVGSCAEPIARRARGRNAPGATASRPRRLWPQRPISGSRPLRRADSAAVLRHKSAISLASLGIGLGRQDFASADPRASGARTGVCENEGDAAPLLRLRPRRGRSRVRRPAHWVVGELPARSVASGQDGKEVINRDGAGRSPGSGDLASP